MHKIFRTDETNASVHFNIISKPGGDKVNLHIVLLDFSLSPVSEVILIVRDISEFLTEEIARVTVKSAIAEAVNINDNNYAAKIHRQTAQDIIKNITL